jgi:hypothetical protein
MELWKRDPHSLFALDADLHIWEASVISSDIRDLRDMYH